MIVSALAAVVLFSASAYADCINYETRSPRGRTRTWQTCSSPAVPPEVTVTTDDSSQATVDRNNAARKLLPNQPKEIPMVDESPCAGCRAPK